MQEQSPFNSSEYREIQERHLFETVDFLLENGIEFAIVAEVKYIDFNPPLPKELYEMLQELSLFILSGYTFESAEVDSSNLKFEAGFGKENFGSILSMPLLAIKQIIVGEYPIAINIAKPMLKKRKIDTSFSMEALLKNPENFKLFKKTEDK